ncbi:hypothetical protein EJC51_01745 [Streptomyces aquilus]|uniref:Uncharacterized protein n=1 Tax=Streptomyces aquilus TaxID=2548456 RepID=A0A3S9HS48_9ACTN|nr:hypothetical protein [Streptomyces aquilus]AZP14976.1 hypothetical protein EJC51_01745 [Streptomyces aquilus]
MPRTVREWCGEALGNARVDVLGTLAALTTRLTSLPADMSGRVIVHPCTLPETALRGVAECRVLPQRPGVPRSFIVTGVLGEHTETFWLWTALRDDSVAEPGEPGFPPRPTRAIPRC